jgi:hypothetical protein
VSLSKAFIAAAAYLFLLFLLFVAWMNRVALVYLARAGILVVGAFAAAPGAFEPGLAAAFQPDAFQVLQESRVAAAAAAAATAAAAAAVWKGVLQGRAEMVPWISKGYHQERYGQGGCC